jgi:hypothetical protein
MFRGLAPLLVQVLGAVAAGAISYGRVSEHSLSSVCACIDGRSDHCDPFATRPTSKTESATHALKVKNFIHSV